METRKQSNQIFFPAKMIAIKELSACFCPPSENHQVVYWMINNTRIHPRTGHLKLKFTIWICIKTSGNAWSQSQAQLVGF